MPHHLRAMPQPCSASKRRNVLFILDARFLSFQVIIIYAEETDVRGVVAVIAVVGVLVSM